MVRARRAMASSSKGKLSTEERLKEMDKALANLQQLLQHQLDFLENLEVEAGRRLEQLESDITMTKIGFAEELDKLHKELKNPQQEFDERMKQLEAKMAQLINNWSQESRRQEVISPCKVIVSRRYQHSGILYLAKALNK